MASNIGYAFAPGSASIPLGQASPKGLGGPQSAVQVKSLSIPQREVQGSIAPLPLLNGAGANGLMEPDLLRQLVAAFAPQGQQPTVPSLAPQAAPVNDNPVVSGVLPSGIGQRFDNGPIIVRPRRAPAPPAAPDLPPAPAPSVAPAPTITQSPTAPQLKRSVGQVHIAFQRGAEVPPLDIAPHDYGFGAGGTIKPPRKTFGEEGVDLSAPVSGFFDY